MQSNSLWGWLNSLSKGDMETLILCVFFGVTGIVAMVCITIYAVHKTRLNDSLKRDLVERGLSAEEISTIVGSKHVDWPYPKRRGILGRRYTNA